MNLETEHRVRLNSAMSTFKGIIKGLVHTRCAYLSVAAITQNHFRFLSGQKITRLLAYVLKAGRGASDLTSHVANLLTASNNARYTYYTFFMLNWLFFCRLAVNNTLSVAILPGRLQPLLCFWCFDAPLGGNAGKIFQQTRSFDTNCKTETDASLLI